MPSTFDPIQNPGTVGNYTRPEFYDQLVQLDADVQPEAMLATDWEFNDDGTELTMTRILDGYAPCRWCAA